LIASAFAEPSSISNDGQQPRPRVFAAKTSKELEGTQARLLRHVLCVVVVASEPAGEVIGGIQMRQNRLFK